MRYSAVRELGTPVLGVLLGLLGIVALGMALSVVGQSAASAISGERVFSMEPPLLLAIATLVVLVGLTLWAVLPPRGATCAGR